MQPAVCIAVSLEVALRVSAAVAGLLPLPAPRRAGWRALRSAQGRGRGSPVRIAAVAGLALPPPLRRAWAAQGGRVVACSQAGSLDVQLRDVALGRARTVRWDPPLGA